MKRISCNIVTINAFSFPILLMQCRMPRISRAIIIFSKVFYLLKIQFDFQFEFLVFHKRKPSLDVSFPLIHIYLVIARLNEH